jgi:receptor protein-tyrosine kinase
LEIVSPVDIATENPPRFADYVRPAWQRKWLIGLVVVLATVGTFAYSRHQPKVYDAGTLVYYQPPTDPLTGSSIVTDRQLGDVAGLLEAQSVAATVAQQIGYRGSAQALLGQITVSNRTGQDFIAISASSGAPRQAAVIANAYAQELVTLTNSGQRQTTTREIQGLSKQLAQTGKSAETAVSRQELTSEISTLQASLLTPTGTRQVSPATAPTLPTSPNPKKDAIFAFVLSLVLAVSAAYGLERFDRRLKEPDDLARHYRLPLLAALPHSPDPAFTHDGLVDLGRGFHEVFALLRTNIHLLTLDDPLRSIAVVSAVPGEGKSTIVRNLAITFAEAGSRVAVIETDLRRPMQSSLFGVPSGPGLTEVLAGVAALGDVIHRVPGSARGIDTLARIGEAPGRTNQNGHRPEAEEAMISVLLAGARPPNPTTVLESARIVELLDELRGAYDVLIFDSAPMLSVTDSVPLVRYADATLIVGRLNLTTRDNVRRMSSFLGRMSDARLLGVIANDFSDLDASGYGYGYGYGYGHEPAGRSGHATESAAADRAAEPARNAERT